MTSFGTGSVVQDSDFFDESASISAGIPLRNSTCSQVWASIRVFPVLKSIFGSRVPALLLGRLLPGDQILWHWHPLFLAVVAAAKFLFTLNYPLHLQLSCLHIAFRGSMLNWLFRLNVPILPMIMSLLSVLIWNGYSCSLLLSGKVPLTWVPYRSLGGGVVLSLLGRFQNYRRSMLKSLLMNESIFSNFFRWWERWGSGHPCSTCLNRLNWRQ